MPKVTQLKASEALRQCPECGYQNGFHVSFRRVPSDKHGNQVAVQLICPSCSAVFDVGLRTQLPLPA
jgi:hypothetical protein